MRVAAEYSFALLDRSTALSLVPGTSPRPIASAIAAPIAPVPMTDTARGRTWSTGGGVMRPDRTHCRRK